ncbi:MAG: hypothetical protein ACI8YQ_003794 [Polaribacter sp.]|jgi:hypothetical protein
MKSLITTLSFCLIFFASCKTDTKTSSDTANSQESVNEVKPPTPTSADVHVPSAAAAPLIGLWHYQDIVHIRKEEVEKYTGRWINIKRDDTFTSGIYLKENNSGTWSYNEETKIIQLMPKETEDIQTDWLVNGSGEFLILLGSTDTNKTGMQIRMSLSLDGSKPGK